MTLRDEKWVAVGLVERAKGIKGEVRVQMYNPDSKLLSHVSDVQVGESEENLSPVSISNASAQAKHWVLGFREIQNRTEAEKLKGKKIFIRRADFPAPRPGEAYVFDLIGANVEKADGKFLGQLKGVQSTASNDIYVVEKNGKEILLPALSNVILKLDLKNNRVIVNLPEEINAF